MIVLYGEGVSTVLLDAQARQQMLMIDVTVAAIVAIHNSKADQSGHESTPTHQSSLVRSGFGLYKGCGRTVLAPPQCQLCGKIEHRCCNTLTRSGHRIREKECYSIYYTFMKQIKVLKTLLYIYILFNVGKAEF